MCRTSKSYLVTWAKVYLHRHQIYSHTAPRNFFSRKITYRHPRHEHPPSLARPRPRKRQEQQQIGGGKKIHEQKKNRLSSISAPHLVAYSTPRGHVEANGRGRERPWPSQERPSPRADGPRRRQGNGRVRGRVRERRRDARGRRRRAARCRARGRRESR